MTQKVTNILRSMISVLAISVVMFQLTSTVTWTNALSVPTVKAQAATTVGSGLDAIRKNTGLSDFDSQGIGHSNSSYEPGASNITSVILYVVDLARYFLGTVAVLVIIISGVRLVTTTKNVEDVAEKQKENIKYAAIGLVVIFISEVLVRQVFYGEAGEVVSSQASAQLAAERGTEQLRGVYFFAQVFIGAVSILMIIISGVMMVASGGNEDRIKKAKDQIIWAVAGIVLIGLSELVIKDIVFPDQGTRLSDVNRFSQLTVQLTNFISSFMATIAIALFMYGGFLYVTGGQNEDNIGKAKKVFTGAAIGLIIAMAAFGIVNTVIKFEPLPENPTTTQEVGTEETSFGV